MEARFAERGIADKLLSEEGTHLRNAEITSQIMQKLSQEKSY